MDNNLVITSCCRAWLLLVFFTLTTGATAAQEESPFFRGDLSYPEGNHDVNPCVDNVVHAVSTLRDHGTTLGFNWGADYLPVLGTGTKNHWQGLQRLFLPDRPFPYLIVSSSHRQKVLRANGDIEDISWPAHFAVVELGSRSNDGGRLRSNRLEFSQLTRHVRPDPADKIVVSQVVSHEFDHPGGIQSIGKYVLVGSDGNIEHVRATAEFTLWDLSDPLEPRLVWDQPRWELPVANANSVGIVKLEDGRNLMLRALASARELEFYLLNENLDENPALYLTESNLWDRWSYTELQSELRNSDGSLDLTWADLENRLGIAGYQSTNLVTECETGALYLIAAHGRRPQGFGGGDFVDAFRLDVPKERPNPDAANSGIIITKVASRHMFPAGNAGEGQGDLQAAGGVFVSPEHKLFFYATEHGVGGPGGSVRMIEFGPEEPTSEVRFAQEAWVEFYSERSFTGRSIILDYADRELRNYANLADIENFNDLAASLIYGLPPGLKLRLYADLNQEGEFIELTGTGSVLRLSDLSQIPLPDAASLENQISSAEWIEEGITPVGEAGQNLPEAFELFQNYPNPFNPTTTINYQIHEGGPVRMVIYDIKGHLIRTLVEGQHAPGAYTTTWSGEDDLGNEVASGTYMYRLEMGELVKTRKLTLLR